MNWPTAQAVVTQAALELGIVQSSGDLGDDVYLATDPTLLQLVALLKRAGRELVDEAQWTHLRQEFGIYTNAGGQSWGAYALPPDWRNMLDQTGWNRTNRLPMAGPLSEQEWSYVNSRVAGVVLNVLFRPMQGLMVLYPTSGLTSGMSIVMTYKSSWWVQEAASTRLQEWATATEYKNGAIVSVENAQEPYVKNFYRCVSFGTSNADPPGGASASVPASGPIVSSTDTALVWNWIGCSLDSQDDGLVLNFGWSSSPSSGADRLMFEEQLLVAKLKLLWLKAKGFDSMDAADDYKRIFDSIVANDSAAPKMNLARPGMVIDRLLGAQNYPITGYGGT